MPRPNLSFSLTRRLLLALVGLVLTSLGVGCSRGPIARAYHNLAGRDNGYFLAREKVKELEFTLHTTMVSDYNKTLPVLPPLTEAVTQPLEADLEDIVKKASLPLTRHKSSNWADDAYFVVGQARYYKMDYDEALKVFKYLNTTSKDPNVKHAALIWLMRTFINLKQIDNAQAVSDQLDKEKGIPQNARDLFLTRAQLHIIRNEPEKAIVNLRLAIPEVKYKNERSRIRFILGQLYQQTNQDALAYEQYRLILRRNPPYELDLFTKLNLAQVTQVKDADQRARIEKYLNRLVKDPKNLEYRDKIYYEMARLEYRQQHYAKALELLGKSAKASTVPTQKPYTYLLAARIAYENLQNYRLAQRYYDSTSKVIAPEAPEYLQVQERAEVLTRFVGHLDVVEGQDSLQAVARLDSTERNALMGKMIEAELARRDAEAKKQAELAEIAERSGPAPITDTPGLPGARPGGASPSPAIAAGAVGGTGIWYFDNPQALGTARADFIRRWGNRTNQDNWRLASVSQRNPAGGAGGADKTGGLADGAKGDSAQAKGGDTEAPSPEQARLAAAKQLRDQYLAGLPKTPADFHKSDSLIEESLYQLARIYDERLHEPENAIERYTELLRRFPASAHAPEALYALYLLADKAKDTAGKQKWAAELRQKFPKTKYAKLVDDPDFMHKLELVNARARVMYDSAYALYRDGLHPKASRAVATIRQQYPVNDISDKLALLDAMIVGYTAKPADYRAALTRFKTDYPASPLLKRADELLATVAAYESGTLNQAPDSTASASTSAEPGAPAAPAVIYATNKAVTHFVMLIYPQDAAPFQGIEVKYSDYNRQYHSASGLKTTSLLFGTKNQLLVIKSFEDARAALNYAARQTRRAPSPLAKIPYGTPYQVVVISDENLPRFYQARDLDGYLAFYQENYK